MSSPSRHVAESPWFWVLVFTGSGFVFLALMQSRIAKRQAQIEQKYQNRRIAEEYRRTGRINPAQPEDDALPQAPPSDRMLLVAQWPLMCALGAITLLSAVMLVRRQQRFRREDRNSHLLSPPALRSPPPPFLPSNSSGPANSGATSEEPSA